MVVADQAMTGTGGPKIGVFDPGARHSRQTALAFQETGQLAWYATAQEPHSSILRIDRLLPGRRQRQAGAAPPSYPDGLLIRRFPTASRFDRAAGWFGAGGAAWSRRRGGRRFAHDILKLVEREPVDVLWGYDGAALEVFRWAKPRGIRCVLDQTVAHASFRNAALAAEQESHPDFFPLDYAPLEPAAMTRQDEELALADLVVAGSEFCARTLRDKGCDPDKLRVVPYGYDDAAFPAAAPERTAPASRPAQFLFVGAVSPAQGIAYLLEAFRAIPPERANLTLLGPLDIPLTTFARYAARVDHRPDLPPARVIRHLWAADGIISACLFEDGGATLSQALGAGLGIIQSSHADLPTIHGRNGIVIDRLSSEALVQAIDDALQPPERLATWGHESWLMRSERSWSTYRRAVARIITAA